LSGSNVGGVGSMPFGGSSSNPFNRDSTNKFQFSSNRNNSILTSNPISSNPKYNLSNFIKEAENFNNLNLQQNINNLQSTENFRIIKNKYDNTLATATDLLEAEVTQLQSRLMVVSATVDAIVAYNKLLQTAGILTP
jgi:hypothetical protein